MPGIIAATVAILSCQNDVSIQEGSHLVLVEDLDTLGLRLEERWRVSLEETVERLNALAVWDDGTIWVASRSGTVWEMAAGGGRMTQVGESGRGTTQMARTPSGGVAVLSTYGVTRFGDRRDPGVFTEHYAGYEARGFVVLPGGDYVASYASDPRADDGGRALHRFAEDGRHLNSWHPVFAHESWRIVLHFSGGPLAVTGTGDLLLAEATRFRITKYRRGLSDSASVVVDDEGIVLAEAIKAAIDPDGSFSLVWTRTIFVDEMSDGHVLAVVREVTWEGRERRFGALWVLLDDRGSVVARSRYDVHHRYVARGAEPGRYVVLQGDGTVAELDVSVVPVTAAPAS